MNMISGMNIHSFITGVLMCPVPQFLAIGPSTLFSGTED